MNTEKTGSPYLKIKEVAQLLRRSPGCIYKYIKEKKFGENVVIRVGKGFLINSEKLKEWMTKDVGVDSKKDGEQELEP